MPTPRKRRALHRITSPRTVRSFKNVTSTNITQISVTQQEGTEIQNGSNMRNMNSNDIRVNLPDNLTAPSTSDESCESARI